MAEKNNFVLVIGAIVAFVLQIALAPAIALFSAQPNVRSWVCCTT